MLSDVDMPPVRPAHVHASDSEPGGRDAGGPPELRCRTLGFPMRPEPPGARLARPWGQPIPGCMCPCCTRLLVACLPTPSPSGGPTAGRPLGGTQLDELASAPATRPATLLAALELAPEAESAALLAVRLQQAVSSGAMVHLPWVTNVLALPDGYIPAPGQEACLQVFGGLSRRFGVSRLLLLPQPRAMTARA